MPHRRRMAVLLVLVITGLFIAGCDGAVASRQRITAKDEDEYSAWQSRLRSRATKAQWEDFRAAHAALNQFLALPNDGREVKAALRQMADGKTLEELLHLGLWAKLRNLELLRHELQQIATSNSMLITKPGDAASAQYLRDFQAREAGRLARVDHDIALLRGKLSEAKQSGIELAPHPLGIESGRPPASREEVLAEIETLIRERRAWAMLKYGAWPVRIDRDGAALTPTERDHFQELAAHAQREGHVVVPVRIKGQWLHYNGSSSPPNLPPGVVALLTPADIIQIADRWTQLEAEVWARRTSFEESK